jgi:tetratricopeptide (TPR) repeat protein
MFALGRRAASALASLAFAALFLAGPGCFQRGRLPRVLLVGLDGVDPAIVERLSASGRLPTFTRLRLEGAGGVLASREPLLSPLLWTSVATGRKAQDHGILDFVEVAPDGRPVPITSSRRTAPALWNIAREFGRRSGFVGWYASYPAEDVLGFQVSDRIAFHQVRSATASSRVTFPEDLAGELERRFGAPKPDVDATRRRFLEDPKAAVSTDGGRRLEALAKVHATAEYYRRALPFLQERYGPELLGVYFEIVDACGHLFMEDAPPRRPEVEDGDYRAFANTVDRCYEYQDEVLAAVLRLEGRDTVSVVCSDHGFKSGDARPRTAGRADAGLAPLWHRREGIVLVHGRGVVAGRRLEKAGLLDVAPTVLAALGLPLASELPGRPLRAAFADGALRDVPHIAAYTPPAPVALSPHEAAAGDAERIESLRALGYLGPAAAAAHDASGRTATSFLNEGSARGADGDLDGALGAYARVLALKPQSVEARVYAARIHLQRGEIGVAGQALDEAVRIDPKSLAVRLQRAAWAIATRRFDEAADELAAARALDDRVPTLHLLEARLLDAAGRSREALAALRRAEPFADSDALRAEVLVFEADLASRTGDAPAAEAALRAAEAVAGPRDLAVARADRAMARNDARSAVAVLRPALQADPADPVVARKLGEALTAAGSPTEAEAAFRQAIREAKDAAQAEAAFGALSLLYQKEGREEDARQTLRAAVARLADSEALWGMLGAALGRAGDLSGALSAYERSVTIRPTPLACKTLAALVFEVRKDRERAVALWKQSLALDPDQAEVRDFLRRYGPPPTADARR